MKERAGGHGLRHGHHRSELTATYAHNSGRYGLILAAQHGGDLLLL